MTAKTYAMVIGANGGIGCALVKQLAGSGCYANIYAVSRSVAGVPVATTRYIEFDSADKTEVESFSRDLAAQELKFSCIICCSEILHGGDEYRSSIVIKPEKRLEEITSAQ